jgi:hypothetical protein
LLKLDCLNGGVVIVVVRFLVVAFIRRREDPLRRDGSAA